MTEETTRPEQKLLTNDQIDSCIEAADSNWADAEVPVEWARHFAHAIADALAQPKQGPVQKPAAVVSSCTGAGDKGVRVKWLGGFPQIGDRLYTAPPQRPWVDLTDEEISEIAINNPPMVHDFARAVLAKSKEKNNG